MLFYQWLRRGWYFENDGSGSGGAKKKEDDPKTDDSAGGDDAEKAGKKKKEVAEIAFTAEQQALVDQKIGEARTKEREKAKAELEAESAKAKKKAEEDALKDKQEWQTLAEKRQADLDELTKQKAELEPFKGQAEKYKKALDDILAAQKKDLPKHIVELLEPMDPVDAMAYITKHAKDLGAKPLTYGETPDGKEKKVSDDDKKDAQKASQGVITRSF